MYNVSQGNCRARSLSHSPVLQEWSGASLQPPKGDCPFVVTPLIPASLFLSLMPSDLPAQLTVLTCSKIMLTNTHSAGYNWRNASSEEFRKCVVILWSLTLDGCTHAQNWLCYLLYKYIQVVSVAVYIPSRFSLFELCACQETEKTKVEMYNILACSEFKMYVYKH